MTQKKQASTADTIRAIKNNFNIDTVEIGILYGNEIYIKIKSESFNCIHFLNYLAGLKNIRRDYVNSCEKENIHIFIAEVIGFFNNWLTTLKKDVINEYLKDNILKF